MASAYPKITKQPGMQFRRALLKISKQLNASDLEEMIFLIGGLPEKPGYAELEKATTPNSFFITLVKQDLITADDYELLEYLLDEIGQKALIKQFRDLMTEDKNETALPSNDTQNTSSNEFSQSSPKTSLENSPGATGVNSSSSLSDSGISIPDQHTVSPNAALSSSSSSNPQIPLATSTPIRSKQDVSVRPKMPKPMASSELPTNHASSKATGQIPLPNGPSPNGYAGSSSSQEIPVRSSCSTQNKAHNQSNSSLPDMPTSSKPRENPTGNGPCVNSTIRMTNESNETVISTQVAQVHQQKTTVYEHSSKHSHQANPTLKFEIYLGDQNKVSHAPAANPDLQMHCKNVLSNEQQAVDPKTAQASSKTEDNRPEEIKIQDVSGVKVSHTNPQFSHSTSWPEVHESHNSSVSRQGRIQDTERHASSFGIKPLTSAEVPGFGIPMDLNRSMSAPNSSDFGPTIQSPSISLENASVSQAQTTEHLPDGSEIIFPMGPPMSAGYRVPNVGQQSRMVLDDRHLQEQMGSLSLQNHEDSLQATKGSILDTTPSSDLETDAPDEGEGNAAFYAGGNHYVETPPDNLHNLNSRHPVSNLSPLRNTASQTFSQKGLTSSSLTDNVFGTSRENSSPLGFTTPAQTNPYQRGPQKSSSRVDKFEEIKRKVQDSLDKQRASKEQGLREPAHDIDDQSTGQLKLRKYQEELATPAKTGGNFVICAPTGSGKTLTAASICRHFYDRAKANGDHFKALFIVNMRHLTEQQTNAFRENFPDGTVATIGETEMLSKVFYIPNHAVVMVTSQILLNTLEKKNPAVTLRDISMIIFDECHHTTQDHPYNEIMKLYLKNKKLMSSDGIIGKSGRYLPQILGLSASLGVGHGKDAYRHILTLCANMDAANVIQVVQNEHELKKHVNSPEQDEILYAQPRHSENRELWPIIEKIMLDIESQVWPKGIHEIHGTSSYEQWVVLRRQEAEQTSERVHVVACLYLFEFNRTLMLYDELRGVDALQYLKDSMDKRDVKQEPVPIEELCRAYIKDMWESMKDICKAETDAHNPKLDMLGQLLRRKFVEKPKSKGIILTRTRRGTQALVDFIEETQHLKYLSQRVKPIRLVGQGQDTETEKYMTEHEQKVALQMFREDDTCNVLVATDIAQEGLDMPACNFVIRYNFVSNEIGTVQSKGRARAKQSECFLIVERNSKLAERELQNHQNVKDMQAAMKKLNQLPEERRVYEITTRQEEIYREIQRNEEEVRVKKGLHDPEDVKLFCKECNEYITKASFMRTKGCHYTCIDPDIKDRVKIIKQQRKAFRTTVNIGIFKCAKTDCGQQLGTAIDFLDEELEVAHKGYGFKVTSFLFKLPDGSPKTYKKWKCVTFDIPEHESV